MSIKDFKLYIRAIKELEVDKLKAEGGGKQIDLIDYTRRKHNLLMALKEAVEEYIDENNIESNS